jgi:hypothetical protein
MNPLLRLLNDVVLMKASPGCSVCGTLSIFNSASEYSLYSSLAQSPKCVSKKRLRANMNGSFAPFTTYVTHLARGKLDGYLDSIHLKDKPSVPGIVLSTDLQLLLHSIGTHPDKERIRRLFVDETVFVIFSLTNTATTDIVFPPSATCSASPVQGKPVFPLMASALIGALFILQKRSFLGMWIT